MDDTVKIRIQQLVISSIESTILYHVASEVLSKDRIDLIIGEVIRSSRQKLTTKEFKDQLGDVSSHDIFKAVDDSADMVHKSLSSIYDAKYRKENDTNQE